MSKVFDLDGPLFRFMTKVSNIIILNLLWLFCSLPLVTIGASTTALYSVSFKLAEDSEGYIIKTFFSAFKANFKQATGIHSIFLLIGAVMGADIYIVAAAPNILGDAGKPLKYVAVAGLILLFLVAELAFPLLARFDNSVKNMLKNAILIGLGNPLSVLIITAINVGIPGIVVLFTADYYTVAFVWALCGVAITAYFASFVYNKLFQKYMPTSNNEEAGEEDR